MTLWARSRRLPVLLIAVLVLAVVDALLGERVVTVPSVVGAGASTMLVSAFLPLLWAAVLADSFASRCQGVEVRPSRHLAVLDVTLLVVAVAGAAYAHAPAVGPVLVLSGLACAVTLRRGSAAGVFGATAVVLGTTLYGLGAPGARYIRVLQADGDPTWSCVLGVSLCVVACGPLLTDRIGTDGAD